MKTVVMKVSPSMERRLARIKQMSGKSIHAQMQAALERHVQDMEDYLSAVETLEKVESGEMSVRSLEEWKRDYDRRHQVEN